jgi:predicted CopG family antitoxin
MAYNTIIHGARGISYYSPKDITIESDAWMDLKNIATEIHSLSDILTSYVSFRNVAVDNENIETLLMEHNGSLYLLCANTGKDFIGNVTFTISGLQLNSLLEFFENRAISINSNQFSDQFSGYQVHVYKIDNI